MLVLGHTGVALGAIEGALRLSGKRRKNPIKIDFRFVLIGALLPDIIDKPIGMWLLRDFFSNGRIFAHTLLFNLLLIVLGFYLYKKWRATGLLVLGISSSLHLIQDRMWLSPHTLLWPALGLGFPRTDISHWLENVLYKLFSTPSVYIPEAVGGSILLWFGLGLLRRGMVWRFLLKGES